MGVVLLIIGILLTGNIIGVMIMTGFEIGTAVGILLGIMLIVWGANYKKFKESRGFLRFLKAVFKLVLIYIIGVSCFLAVFGSVNTCEYNEEYAIVLGCGIRDSQPTKALRLRLNKAAEYAQKNPNATIIVSGGQGLDENTSEANVMYSYLVEKGVSADRILKEDTSHSTYENFKFTKNLYNVDSAVIITNRFHMFRANFYAKMCGIKSVSCPASTDVYLIAPMYIRETIALIKMIGYLLPFI